MKADLGASAFKILKNKSVPANVFGFFRGTSHFTTAYVTHLPSPKSDHEETKEIPERHQNTELHLEHLNLNNAAKPWNQGQQF